MKRKHYLILGIILLNIYFFVFPPLVGPELVVRPRESVSQGEDGAVPLSAKGSGGGELLAFETKEAFGYLKPDLSSLTLKTKERRADVSSLGSLLYGGDKGRIQLVSPEGQLIFDLPGKSRTPIFDGGRIYFFGKEGLTIEERSALGHIRWKRSLSAMVTSVDAGEKLTLLGLISGEWLLIDGEGRVVRRGRPGGSRLEAVYGVGLSPKERYAAVVSGVDPQRFVLYDLIPEDPQPIYHTENPLPLRRQTAVGFLESGDWLFWERTRGISLLSLAEKENPRFIPLRGRFGRIHEVPGMGFLAVSSRTANQGWMKWLNRDFSLLTEASFPPGETDPFWHGNSLFFLHGERMHHWCSEVVR